MKAQSRPPRRLTQANDTTIVSRLSLSCLAVAHAARLTERQQKGAERVFRCPRHDDVHPSLRIRPSKDLWRCDPCDRGGNPWTLAAWCAGVEPHEKAAVGQWLTDHGLGIREGIQTFPYRDAEGTLVFTIHRKGHGTAKRIWQSSPQKASGLPKALKQPGSRPVYRLPELLARAEGTSVVIVEGEPHSDRLWSLGIPATTTSQGAGKASYSDLDPLARFTTMVLLPDNDEPGRRHMHQLAEQLVQQGIPAEHIRWLELPNLPPKGDVLDWLQTEGSEDALRQLIHHAPTWIPAPVSQIVGEPLVPKGEDRGSKLDQLMTLAESLDLYHTQTQEPYARIPGQVAVTPIPSLALGGWLRQEFRRQFGHWISSAVIAEAQDILASQAQWEAPEQQIWLRVGQPKDAAVSIDLGHSADIVTVTAAGWQLLDHAPIGFRRPNHLGRLPTPVLGGALETLRPFLNCADTDWPLVIGWLVAALRPHGPYPILLLQGPQGSAKSTTTRMLLELVDPGNPETHPLRLPTNEDDLAIIAHNHWALGFDNLSGLSPRMSDALARLATGAGIARRQLYTNKEESLIALSRPIILNGIEEIAARADLLDRAMRVECLPMEESIRRSEQDLWREFQQLRPQILGALLTAVGVALSNLSTVRPSHLPRMADFATWVVAAEPALPWEPGTFLRAYQANYTEAQTNQVAEDELAQALVAFFGLASRWEGTATELWRALRPNFPREDEWWRPYGTVRGLSNGVRRIGPLLHQLGWQMLSPHRTGMRRSLAFARITESIR